MTERAREAAFAKVMGSIDMPDDNTAEYDEWLFNAAIDAYIAALAETHAVVPREPTEAMQNAAVDEMESLGYLCDEGAIKHTYRAMLNAAAQQPTERT